MRTPAKAGVLFLSAHNPYPMAHKTTSYWLSLIAISALTAILATAVLALPVSANNGKDKSIAVDAGTTVQIGDNGNVLVRGAEVTALANGVVTAETEWAGTNITWSVDTDDADVVTRDGDNSSYGDIDVGDEISFSGVLTSGSDFSVNAGAVRNWSIVDDDDDTDRDGKQGNAWGWWKNFSSSLKGNFSFGHK